METILIPQWPPGGPHWQHQQLTFLDLWVLLYAEPFYSLISSPPNLCQRSAIAIPLTKRKQTGIMSHKWVTGWCLPLITMYMRKLNWEPRIWFSSCLGLTTGKWAILTGPWGTSACLLEFEWSSWETDYYCYSSNLPPLPAVEYSRTPVLNLVMVIPF